MFTLSGKIVVKETGAGIPDLLVRAFDLDVPNQKYSSQSATNDMNIDQQLPYDSLGSVLTDAEGHFLFEFEEEDFKLSGEELRPDIFLVIGSPEDVGSANAQSQTIHTTNPLRLKSGRNEAFFMRIPEEVLKRYDLHSSVNEEYLLKSFKLSAETNKANFNELQVFSEKIGEKVTGAFKEFGKKKTTASPSNFIPFSELDEQLGEVQSKIVASVSERLNTINQDAGYEIELDEHAMKRIGILVDGEPKEITLSAESVEQMVGITPDLTTARLRCIREITENDIENSTPDTNTDSPAGNTPDESESLTIPTRDSLLHEVQQQIASATTPEVALDYRSLTSEVDNSGKMCDRLSGVSICGGPADVTSYHDFRTVQMAFEQIWTEAFDNMLEEDARELYAETVKLAEGYSPVRLPNTVQVGTPVGNPQQGIQGVIVAQPTGHGQPVYVQPAAQPSGTGYVQSSPVGTTVVVGNSVPSNPVSIPQEINTVDDLGKFIRQFSSQSTPVSEYVRNLAEKLDQRLSEAYKFKVFAPDSVNYGLIYTFRQKWEPQSYQVGRLVSSLPLAPKETRKYSTKLTKVLSRNQKRLEDQEYKSHSESSSTSRAESEIINKAQNKTSFNLNAGASYSAGVISAEMRTQFGTESENLSSETKKNFREAVVKSANDFRKQNKLELEMLEKSEFESNTSGEVSNPNDEITVTYLFYELQRQYDISEELYKIEPVIFVANEVPTPDQIDFDWMVANAWILQKVILDPMYLNALQYLGESGLSGTVSLDVLRRNLDQQAMLVQSLTATLNLKNSQLEHSFNLLLRIIRREEIPRANDTQRRDATSPLMAILNPIGAIISAFTENAIDEERLKNLKETTNMSMERLEKSKAEFTEKLSYEFSQLQSITTQYVDELKRVLDKEHAITQLRIHIKENIIYYMQAIWDHEPADQRFFRLFDKEVDWFEASGSVTLTPRRRAGARRFRVEIPSTTRNRVVKKKLVEIADLDNILGYKGNYMIFATKKRNRLHQYMMRQYVDNYTGKLQDPDNLGQHSTQELIDYLKCLRRSNPQAYEQEKDAVLALINEKLVQPQREKERIIVPTDSVYIEALPGVHPVLENFKLAHRGLDVKKVQAEVRRAELENLRYASRLLYGELSDPDFDKQTLISGVSSNDIDLTDN